MSVWRLRVSFHVVGESCQGQAELGEQHDPVHAGLRVGTQVGGRNRTPGRGHGDLERPQFFGAAVLGGFLGDAAERGCDGPGRKPEAVPAVRVGGDHAQRPRRVAPDDDRDVPAHRPTDQPADR